MGGGILYGIGSLCKVVDAPVRAISILTGIIIRTCALGLDSRYGIKSEKPIGKNDLEKAVKIVVENEKNLKNLTNALKTEGFAARTKAISGVIRDVAPEGYKAAIYTDETIGKFLSLAKKQIKLSQRKRESSKKVIQNKKSTYLDRSKTDPTVRSI